VRLDPFALPHSVRAHDMRADGGERAIDIDRYRIVVRRAVAGIRMRLAVPVTDFDGVALELRAAGDDAPPTVALTLAHRDRALSVTLAEADTADDMLADWQAWGRVFGRPLLVADSDGRLRQPVPHLGALRVARAWPRRRRRSPHKARRPAALMRRKAAKLSGMDAVYRGEREIIARN
jgi:hypothetical protein